MTGAKPWRVRESDRLPAFDQGVRKRATAMTTGFVDIETTGIPVRSKAKGKMMDGPTMHAKNARHARKRAAKGMKRDYLMYVR